MVLQIIHKLSRAFRYQFEHRVSFYWKEKRVCSSSLSTFLRKNMFLVEDRSMMKRSKLSPVINSGSSDSSESEIHRFNVSHVWTDNYNYRSTKWIFSGWRIPKTGQVSERIRCEARYYCSIVSCLYIAAAKNFDKITVIKAITVKVNTDEVDRISIALSTANDYRAWATRL